jgi:hypothetical protein
MRRILLIAVAVAGLALGIAIGWFIWHDEPVDIGDDSLVTRLRAERDSLVALAAQHDAVVVAWKDSVAVRDRRVAQGDSISSALRRKVRNYETAVREFAGGDDDLLRELNRAIRTAGPGGSPDAPSPGPGAARPIRNP